MVSDMFDSLPADTSQTELLLRLVVAVQVRMSPFICLILPASVPSREPSDNNRHMEVNPSLASPDKMIKHTLI